MNLLINEKGELLEILQEHREPQENERIVLLNGYYEVFNDQRFKFAKWNFEEDKWIGYHEPIYDGEKWVEGASQEMLDLIEAQRIEQLLTPSQAEVDKATREIETITLLTDLGVI